MAVDPRLPGAQLERGDVGDESIEQLTAISEARNLRYLCHSSDLPPLVWTVIYRGCVLTIGFGHFFGSSSFGGQALMCATFAVLPGMTILAVLELAHPYQGSMAISDAPFRYSLSRMNAMSEFKTAR